MIDEVNISIEELDREIARLSSLRESIMLIKLNTEEEKFFTYLSENYSVTMPEYESCLDTIESDLNYCLDDMQSELLEKTNIIENCKREIRENKLIISKLSKDLKKYQDVRKQVTSRHKECKTTRK